MPCETENVSSTIQPDWFLALNSKNSRDLPVPASAIAATICPCPAFACSAARVDRLHLALAADELRQAASGRTLQPRAQWPEPGHLVHIDRLGDAFDLGRAQRLEREVALDQFARLLADGDRSGRRERLHPRGEIGRVPDRRVFGMAAAGRDRAHHHFAGVHADARLDRQIAGLAQSRRIAAQLFLHPKRSVQRALRMILVRDRRAEQREDSVASRLHDVAVVAADRVDHQLECGIDNRARLFGIEVLLEFRRAFDVREQRGDRLALTVN